MSKSIIAIMLLVFWATAPNLVAGSISLKFEDASTYVESLSDNPTFLLPPLHAVAHYYKVDFRWDPAREQVILSKDDIEAKLILGNQHALITIRGCAPTLHPLSEPPVMLHGVVGLPPRDIASVLSNLLPQMNVSWDETKATIEVAEANGALSGSQEDLAKSESNGTFKLNTIIIDAGHGGHDPGATRRGVREKDIVLDIALRLKKAIESNSDWKVVLTRDSDEFISLRSRTYIANRNSLNNTLFISIHCNASRSSLGRGLETYIFNMKASDAEAAALAKRENAEEQMDLAYILSYCYHVGTEAYSLDAARKVQTSLIERLKLRNRGVKRAPFYVLAGTRMPAILVELGFISNAYDRKKHQSVSFRQSAAEALFEAIKEFDKSASKSLVKAK